MARVIDSENVVNSMEVAPDRLRAEIGKYLSEMTVGLQDPLGNTPPSNMVVYLDKNFATGIKNNYITSIADNDQVLFPTKRATIYMSGVEGKFRDQDQWQDYIRQTISTGTNFLDHRFELENFDLDAGFVEKNYHHPDYEDITKTFPSNQLLNYNLISYPFKSQVGDVSRVGDIRTEFDNEDYEVGVTLPSSVLIDQYGNRVSNYTGSIEELSVKQRHVFDLQRAEFVSTAGTSFVVPGTSRTMPVSHFPFAYKKRLENRLNNNDLNQVLSDHGKRKQVMQAIKRDLSFGNRLFRIGTEDVPAKIYNLINIATSTRIATFDIASDEIFLLPESEISNSRTSDRFVNGVSAVRFLGNLRTFVKNNSRSYEDIIDADSSQSFFIGYKIEKFLDNDATQPIQTYYTNDRTFVDTQLKYGRKYIYKTKALIAILGSSYSYSNLAVSQNENQMVDEEGQVVTELSSDYGNIISQKYRAYVNVEVSPSFQILEYMVDQDEVVFEDEVPNPPQVYFYNQPHKASVEFFFSQMYEDKDGMDNKILREYLNGVYEIYRLDDPPSSMRDFDDAFLTSIDDQTTLVNKHSGIPDYLADNLNGHYEDSIVQNQKYYYAFKTVTYHGTHSDFTTPFEIEMVKDSDKYKVVVKEYHFPNSKDYTYEARAKRILKITPNIERILFSEEEDRTNWKLDDANMLAKNQTTKFKIRVTSKHTGKKMDINLNFFLDDKTNR